MTLCYVFTWINTWNNKLCFQYIMFLTGLYITICYVLYRYSSCLIMCYWYGYCVMCFVLQCKFEIFMQFCYPISNVLVVVRRPSYTLYDDCGTRRTMVATPIVWRSAYTHTYSVKQEAKQGFWLMQWTLLVLQTGVITACPLPFC